MKFIHVGDVHLGAAPETARGWGNIRQTEIRGTLEKVVSLANDEQADLLLLAGDVFHNPPGQKELEALDEILCGLHSTKTVFMTGNHDYNSRESKWESFHFQSDTHGFCHEKIERIFDEKSNTYIYGLGYEHREITSPLYDHAKPGNEPGYHILLAHGGDETHIPFQKEALKWSGFDYIALGHIHAPEVIFEDLMVYAGSLEPLDHTESGRHGIFIGEFTKESRMVSFYPMNKRGYADIYVTVTADMDREEIMEQAADEMNLSGESQMFSIHVEGEKPAGITLDFDELTGRYMICEVFDETGGQKTDTREELYEKNKGNLIGDVMEALGDNERALSYALEALLHDS